MPTLRITIKMDNAAFSEPADGGVFEVERLLRRVAHNLIIRPGYRETIRDSNGNTVGEAKVTR